MTYKKKLIEVALPLDAINAAARAETARKRGKPTQLHLWWAPRPIVAARAVLWASLVDDPSAHPDQFPTAEDQEAERQRLFQILKDLVLWENSNNERVLAAARAEIEASCEGELPSILDPFCGRGTIPFEAQRLGLPAYGGDLNPVAVLISKAMVEIPPRFAGLPPVNPDARAESGLKTWDRSQGLAEDVRWYGQWIRDRAFDRIGHLYPKVKLPPEQGGSEATVIAWIWARTVESPDPSWSGHVPLVRSWTLRVARKNKPVVWIEPVVDHDTQTITYRIREGGTPVQGTIDRRGAVCLATGSPISFQYIRTESREGRSGTIPIAVVANGPAGRAYLPPHPPPAAPEPEWRPTEQLLGKATVNVGLYGFATWGDLFTNRQLVALTTLSDLLSELRPLIEEHAVAAGLPADGVRLRDGGSGATAYVDAIITYLAFAIDRLADWNNSLCHWEKKAQVPQQLLGRQAIPMTWDFAEANPFSLSTGSLHVTLETVASSLGQMPSTNTQSRIEQRDAVSRLKEISQPVVSTDPPYYDNISYADLADFFYVWLRRNLRDVWPDELSTLLTPKNDELIASPQRAGSKQAAKEHFESGMGEVFATVARVQHRDFPATVFYAFKQEESGESGVASTGWETFLQGVVSAGLAVTGTWPVRTEMTSRRVALGAAALASSIVLALRRRPEDAPLATRSEFLAALRAELPAAVRLLQKESIAPVDMAQSAIGPGMAVFSRYAKVVEADGSAMTVRQALALINEVLQEVLSEEETEFDPDTRWALTWFEQYGLNPGPYGDAETLSKAKDTSVSGVVQAGIATQVDGKVRLLDRDELDPEWDPAEDPRLTVWEVTQYLIARLGESETAAAELLRRVGGGVGERARQLAYLLYQVANRKGWASEAVAYNSLVQAWPELTRLAGRTDTAIQPTLGG